MDDAELWLLIQREFSCRGYSRQFREIQGFSEKKKILFFFGRLAYLAPPGRCAKKSGIPKQTHLPPPPGLVAQPLGMCPKKRHSTPQRSEVFGPTGSGQLGTLIARFGYHGMQEPVARAGHLQDREQSHE
jgi:hypothetical protein